MLIFLEEERLKYDEMEKAYYGVSSTEIFVEMHNYVSNHIKTCLYGISNSLKENGCDDEKRIRIIKELYMKNMNFLEPSLDKFQKELQQIFEVPVSVEQRPVFSDNDIEQLKQEVQKLRQEYFVEHVFLAKLNQKKKLLESLQVQMDQDEKHLDELIKKFKHGIKKKKDYESLKNKYDERFQKFCSDFSEEFRDKNEYFVSDKDCFNALLREFNS